MPSINEDSRDRNKKNRSQTPKKQQNPNRQPNKQNNRQPNKQKVDPQRQPQPGKTEPRNAGPAPTPEVQSPQVNEAARTESKTAEDMRQANEKLEVAENERRMPSPESFAGEVHTILTEKLKEEPEALNNFLNLVNITREDDKKMTPEELNIEFGDNIQKACADITIYNEFANRSNDKKISSEDVAQVLLNSLKPDGLYGKYTSSSKESGLDSFFKVAIQSEADAGILPPIFGRHSSTDDMVKLISNGAYSQQELVEIKNLVGIKEGMTLSEINNRLAPDNINSRISAYEVCATILSSSKELNFPDIQGIQENLNSLYNSRNTLEKFKRPGSDQFPNYTTNDLKVDAAPRAFAERFNAALSPTSIDITLNNTLTPEDAFKRLENYGIINNQMSRDEIRDALSPESIAKKMETSFQILKDSKNLDLSILPDAEREKTKEVLQAHEKRLDFAARFVEHNYPLTKIEGKELYKYITERKTTPDNATTVAVKNIEQENRDTKREYKEREKAKTEKTPEFKNIEDTAKKENKTFDKDVNEKEKTLHDVAKEAVQIIKRDTSHTIAGAKEALGIDTLARKSEELKGILKRINKSLKEALEKREAQRIQRLEKNKQIVEKSLNIIEKAGAGLYSSFTNLAERISEARRARDIKYVNKMIHNNFMADYRNLAPYEVDDLVHALGIRNPRQFRPRQLSPRNINKKIRILEKDIKELNGGKMEDIYYIQDPELRAKIMQDIRSIEILQKLGRDLKYMKSQKVNSPAVNEWYRGHQAQPYISAYTRAMRTHCNNLLPTDRDPLPHEIYDILENLRVTNPQTYDDINEFIRMDGVSHMYTGRNANSGPRDYFGSIHEAFIPKNGETFDQYIERLTPHANKVMEAYRHILHRRGIPGTVKTIQEAIILYDALRPKPNENLIDLLSPQTLANIYRRTYRGIIDSQKKIDEIREEMENARREETYFPTAADELIKSYSRKRESYNKTLEILARVFVDLYGNRWDNIKEVPVR